MSRLIHGLILFLFAIGWLWSSGDRALSWWFRAGIAAWFFSESAYRMVWFAGLRRKQPAQIAFGRAFRIKTVGVVLASLLIGVGGLLVRSWGGFFLAYGALSIGWVWFVMGKQLAVVETPSTGTQAPTNPST